MLVWGKLMTMGHVHCTSTCTNVNPATSITVNNSDDLSEHCMYLWWTFLSDHLSKCPMLITFLIPLILEKLLALECLINNLDMYC